MIVERDKIHHPKVSRALEYIRKHSENNILILDDKESQLLADSTGESSGQKIRRHVILQLETFRFITRDTSTPAWKIQITQSGLDYLDSLNPKEYFQENVVEELVFCSYDWATSKRADKYGDFNIKPYDVVERIMPEIDNKIYLEEMVYFVSKIQQNVDIPKAIEYIKAYRELVPAEKIDIGERVKTILATQNKSKYGNWRKHNKRTFEFFSMGTEFIMDYESDDPVDTFPLRRYKDAIQEQSTLLDYVAEVEKKYPYKDDPEISRDDIEFNTGVEGENIIKNLLQDLSFEIRDFTGSNKGFDILALKNENKFFVEVKSSVNQCSPTLTEKEYKMADEYGEIYILAIVENVFDMPKVYFIINPIEKLKDDIQQDQTTTHTIPRARWIIVAQEGID